MKTQRIRDPLHDLIEFDSSSFEQGLWDTIDSKEFQRLRRIKQLGFSELVYPGATHNRLLHSIGVFHTARQLIALIAQRRSLVEPPERARVALAAALVHDVGHGPFSHAFEEAVKQLDKQVGNKSENRHEIWTARIVREDTDLGKRLEKHFGSAFREEVATLLVSETPTDIYSSVVSSQFDADRLDYVRRDRLMTGAQHGGFDYSWLMANLEVAKVPIAIDDEHYAEVDSLVFGHKAFQAAEAYVLGLFHLYFTVYFHKATRAAEKMLTAILVRIGQHVLQGDIRLTGLAEEHPIVQFIKTRSLDSYLKLDDAVIWGAFPLISECTDIELTTMVDRLLSRNLYKAVDVSASFEGSRSAALEARFRAALTKAREAGSFDENEIYEDAPSRNPYKRRGYDAPDALSKVLIANAAGSYDDLADTSDVVKSMSEKRAYRVYGRDKRAIEKIQNILRETEK